MNGKQHTNSTLTGRARTAVKVALAATILTIGLIGGGGAAAHAGGIVPNGSANLSCGTGYLALRLPIVQANTSGTVWQITEVDRYNGAQWVQYGWTGYRTASLGAGQSQNGAWTEASGQFTRFDQITVATGAAYRLVQWAYVDGAWISTMSSWCFA
jgi:hypothetical protein